MAKNDDGQLKVHQKIVATVDLPGVPRGTHGKVTLKNGFRWIRYRAYFDNGVELGPIDRDQLAPKKEWEQDEARRVAQEREAYVLGVTESMIEG